MNVGFSDVCVNWCKTILNVGFSDVCVNWCKTIVNVGFSDVCELVTVNHCD